MNREEAITVLKKVVNPKVKEAIETLIPELRESEDERIRKWLYDYIERVGRTWGKPGPFDYTQILAWLEKQKVIAAIPDELVECYKNLCERGNRGVASLINAINGINEQKEQKPAEWSEEEEQMFSNILNHYSLIEVPTDGNGISKERYLAFIKSLRPQPKQEWSKEDENKIERLVFLVSVAEEKEMISSSESIDLRRFVMSYHPQSKKEWSKNDTVFLNEITDFFENKTVRLQHDTEMYAHWLKSLPERFQSLAKANEEQNCLSVQAWAARDKDEYVHVFENKPDIGVYPNTWAGLCLGYALEPIFPDLKYEDGPVKVELKFRIIRP